MQWDVDTPAVGTWDLDPLAERVRYPADFRRRIGVQSDSDHDPTWLWRERVHPDDLQPMCDALMAHVEGRSSHYRTQFRLRAAHGGYRWVLSAGQAVERGRDGRALRVLGTLTDLDAIQEAALRQAQAELQARLQHDLRTPLNAVLGFAQLLQAQLGQGSVEQQRRQLAHIEQGGWQLLTQIERALGVAPPAGGRGGEAQSGGGSRASS